MHLSIDSISVLNGVRKLTFLLVLTCIALEAYARAPYTVAPGLTFLVNAPNAGKVRIPLAVTVSADGKVFDRSYLSRGAADLQPLRYEGQYKRHGYHYPKSTVWNGFLYVAYATNKEDVELTRVPLPSLERSN